VKVIPVRLLRTVTLATTWTPRLVVDSAVTSVVPCVGTSGGAVKIVVAPLAVCAGENVPQELVKVEGRAQVATQSTPAFAGSLLTVAETGTGLPMVKEAGGACVMATVMIGVCDEGSALEPVIAQPVIPIRKARQATNGRTVPQKLLEVRSLDSGN
jgi:hypothetical protein